MKKWIIILVVILAAGAVAWKYQGQSIGGSDSSPLLDFVPADTVFYTGGQNAEDVVKIIENHTILSSVSSTNADLKTIFQAMSQEDSPALKFFLHLMNAFDENTDGTYKSVLSLLGAKGTEPFALYNHGFAPVLRFKVAEPAKIETLIENAVVESGWQYQETTLDTTKIRYWPIPSSSPDENKKEIVFAIGLADDIFTFTFFVPSEDENIRKVRFGLAKPEKSLAQTDELKEIQKKYGFKSDLLGFFNVERATTSALNNKEDTLSKTFLSYFPEDFQAKADVSKEVTEACRAEYTSLAAAAPRVVFGYNDLKVKGDQLNMGVEMVWEVNNTEVSTELQKLGGHIPLHVFDSSEQVIGFGLGMDVAGAIPALTSLWNMFISQEFTCESLIKAQEQVKQANPAMLAIATGMAQGVKGFGVSLYDLTIDPVTSFPNKLTAMISLAAENPETVLSLTSLVPQLGGINIPSDGTIVDLPLPLVPPTIPVKAGVKGKHIVIFTGDIPESTLEEISKESLETNGIYGASMSYEKFGQTLMENMGVAQGGADACFSVYEIASLMSDSPMDFNFTFGFDDKGASLASVGNIMSKAPAAENITGEYTLQYLDNNCQWIPAGKEVISKDGTGSYEEQDEAKECVLFSTSYKWTKKFNKLAMEVSSERSRDSCSDELVESDVKNYHCFILNEKDNGFDCFFDPGTENAAVYRYTKK